MVALPVIGLDRLVGVGALFKAHGIPYEQYGEAWDFVSRLRPVDNFTTIQSMAEVSRALDEKFPLPDAVNAPDDLGNLTVTPTPIATSTRRARIVRTADETAETKEDQ